MLDKFKWDTPEHGGAYSNPTLKLTIRPKTLEKKNAAKHTFSMNKAFAKEFELKGDLALAFSWDIRGEVIMAIGVPDTVPNYKAREMSAGGNLFANKRFAEKLMAHVVGKDDIPHKDGTWTFTFRWREEGREGDIIFLNLVKNDQ